jgi:ribosome-associated protein
METVREFLLKGEFIELDNLLKASKIVANGAEARQHIQEGSVTINGQAERRIRRKLRPGDCVEFSKNKILIMAQR